MYASNGMVEDASEIKPLTSAILFKMKHRVPSKKLAQLVSALQKEVPVSFERYVEWFNSEPLLKAPDEPPVRKSSPKRSRG